GRHRRVQRQVHGQPDGAAGWLRRHASGPHPDHLPEFLLSGRALGVQRHSARGGRMRAANEIQLIDLAPAAESFREAVLAGLSRREKAIPCTFLYDAHGSALFDRICELPEYYPTRTERRILDRYAGDIADLVGPEPQLIEFGSGS